MMVGSFPEYTRHFPWAPLPLPPICDVYMRCRDISSHQKIACEWSFQKKQQIQIDSLIHVFTCDIKTYVVISIGRCTHPGMVL